MAHANREIPGTSTTGTTSGTWTMPGPLGPREVCLRGVSERPDGSCWHRGSIDGGKSQAAYKPPSRSRYQVGIR